MPDNFAAANEKLKFKEYGYNKIVFGRKNTNKNDHEYTDRHPFL